MNDFAKEVAEFEGGKVNLPIGQIKEVLKIILERFGLRSNEEIIKAVDRYRKK
jgi:hypothetical protein